MYRTRVLSRQSALQLLSTHSPSPGYVPSTGLTAKPTAGIDVWLGFSGMLSGTFGRGFLPASSKTGREFQRGTEVPCVCGITGKTVLPFADKY